MKKKSSKNIEKTIENEDILNEDIVNENNKDFTTATIESNLETSFFYTNDKFINQLDNAEIFKYIQTKYPELNLENDDPIIKKQIVNLLEDDSFINDILKYYNLTLFEFFSVLYKQFSSIFRGPYLKKLKNILTGKSYLTNGRKKHDY